MSRRPEPTPEKPVRARPALRKLRVVNSSDRGIPYLTRVYDGDDELTNVMRVELNTDHNTLGFTVEVLAGYEIEAAGELRQMVRLRDGTTVPLPTWDPVQVWTLATEYAAAVADLGIALLETPVESSPEFERAEQAKLALRQALGLEEIPIEGQNVTPGGRAN